MVYSRVVPATPISHSEFEGERSVAFEYQPALSGELVELRPLRSDDFRDLYAVAADPLLWEQHPKKIVTKRLSSKGSFATRWRPVALWSRSTSGLGR